MNIDITAKFFAKSARGSYWIDTSSAGDKIKITRVDEEKNLKGELVDVLSSVLIDKEDLPTLVLALQKILF